jgi:hypothetical protein
MAKLTPKQRAKRLSRQQRKADNVTGDEFERINRKADKVLRANSR